jgi:hypothetical protein
MVERLPGVDGIAVQGEDEIASIGMCIGASMAGMRAMTATSGPGLSLMSENLGLAQMLEAPSALGAVVGAARARTGGLREQPEARVGQRLGARDGAGRLEVGARVREPAAEDSSLLVEQDGLRRGRAEVDAQKCPHAFLRMSIAWRKLSRRLRTLACEK